MSPVLPLGTGIWGGVGWGRRWAARQSGKGGGGGEWIKVGVLTQR
jgi:hypothetical protein